MSKADVFLAPSDLQRKPSGFDCRCSDFRKVKNPEKTTWLLGVTSFESHALPSGSDAGSLA